MSLENCVLPSPDTASCCASAYAIHERLIYAQALACAAPGPSSPSARGRVQRVQQLPRRFEGAGVIGPDVWARLGFRRRIVVQGLVVDCRGVLTFVPDEPPTFWLMYDVLAALAVITGALVALLT